MLRRLLVLSVLFVSCGDAKVAESPPSVPIIPVAETRSHTTVVITTPQSTTTTLVLTEEQIVGLRQLQVEKDRETWGKCGEWHDLALQVGWQESEWKTLSRILFRESRCTPDAWNGFDAGLTQINQIHTEWLSQMGFTHPDDMFDPAKNLLFAYRLWSGREANGQCGWSPWSLPCIH